MFQFPLDLWPDRSNLHLHWYYFFIADRPLDIVVSALCSVYHIRYSNVFIVIDGQMWEDCCYWL